MPEIFTPVPHTGLKTQERKVLFLNRITAVRDLRDKDVHRWLVVKVIEEEVRDRTESYLSQTDDPIYLGVLDAFA